MFSAALTVAKTWRQPQWLSTDGWRKKLWRTYTMKCHSDKKKNEMIPFAAT